MKIEHTEDYRHLRAKEYPPLEELADAIYWQARGDDVLMAAYLRKCDAVKAKYSRGSGGID